MASVAEEETPTEEAAGDTGSINASVTDADGFAIIGACVQIDGPVSGEICDNGDGDTNGEDGFITIAICLLVTTPSVLASCRKGSIPLRR